MAHGTVLNIEGTDRDQLHPDSNVAKMSRGIPLDDDDREPWLRAVGGVLRERGGVVACSALREKYRDIIRAEAPGTKFVLLDAPRDALATRLAQRAGHFMPQSLLDSQLATLELPTTETDVDMVDATAPVEQVVQQVCLTR
ncbi:MAG: gluconokinase [Glaciihabitans sp.]|nr:gluconokinase [Glaciihabitans sp.]